MRLTPGWAYEPVRRAPDSQHSTVQDVCVDHRGVPSDESRCIGDPLGSPGEVHAKNEQVCNNDATAMMSAKHRISCNLSLDPGRNVNDTSMGIDRWPPSRSLGSGPCEMRREALKRRIELY